jgi:hypothetical protein
MRKEILQRKWRWLGHTFRRQDMQKDEIHRKREENVDQKLDGNEVWSQR